MRENERGGDEIRRENSFEQINTTEREKTNPIVRS